MTRNQKIWLGFGVAFVLLAGVGTEEVVRNYKLRYKEDDINLLLPAFRQRVFLLMQRLIARGFDPVIVDTKRSATEAAANAAKNTGIVNSLHITGAAADIVSNAHDRNSAAFNAAYEEEIKRLYLTWGGRWARVDVAHVQAIPVALENQYWALTNDTARNNFIQRYYDSLAVA